MKKILFMMYKEGIELISTPPLFLQLLSQSIGYGIVFPLISWLMLTGLLPLKTGDIPQVKLQAEVVLFLKTFYVFLIPFFIAQMLSAFSLPSMSDEIEHQTIEHLLVLPIGWPVIIMGKIIFYLLSGLICSYIMATTYWMSAFLIVKNLQVDYLLSFFGLFIPSIVLYVISLSILISTYTKNTKLSGIFSGIFTWGLFLAIFFLSWLTKFEINNMFLIISSLVLFGSGLTSIILLLRFDSEKLLV